MVKYIELEFSWLQKLAMKIIQQGPIPRHIAFIMDGNRRFAQKNGLELFEGHRKGFDKMVLIWNWAKRVGIKEVTAYAFSIENFKRSKDEVDAVMNLCREKFNEFVNDKDELKKNGVNVKIIGNRLLLPEDIQDIASELENVTQNNNKFRINIAVAYTSRDDITQSMKTILQGVDRHELKSCDITEDLIEKCLYTRHCYPLDLLVRTSGESRLSDFLLWEQCSSLLHFTRTYWPDITFWNFLVTIFYYQKYNNHMSAVRNELLHCHYKYEEKDRLLSQFRIQRFLGKIEENQ